MKCLCAGALAMLCVVSVTAHAQTRTLFSAKDHATVTYHMVHPLHKFDATSKDALFSVNADVAATKITRVEAAVDVTTFDSGNSNRDSHAMEVIDAISYPEARFVASSIIANGDSLTVQGKLTFHGVTHDITAHAVQRWTTQSLDVTGGFDISLTGFSIERPSLLMMPVEDKLTFEFAVSFGL